MSARALSVCLLPLLFLWTPALAVTPPGIVFESEDVCQPKTAWQKNRTSDDHWNLWTEEKDIQRKRSGGAVLASPTVRKDRQRPEDGAPPLHAVVRGLRAGLYQVYVSPPGRPLAYSLDGKTWTRYAGGELDLGRHRIAAGPFELWIDDRYAAPADNPGPAYFDYIRFVPQPEMSADVRVEEAWKGLAYWLRTNHLGRAVPMEQWQLDGFDRDYSAAAVKTQKAGARCWYEFDADGTVYPAAQVSQLSGNIADISLSLGDREESHLVAADSQPRSTLLCLTRPLHVRRGQRLTLTCRRDKDLCRIEGLFLGTEPIRLPEVKIENVAAWSSRPGEVALCWTTSRMAETGVVEYGIGRLTKRTEPSDELGQNHRIVLAGLDPQAAYQARILARHGKAEIASETIRFRAVPPTPGPTSPKTIPLAVPEPTEHPRPDWPVTLGLPFPRGVLARTEDLTLTDSTGKRSGLQAEPLSRWSDGSVAWAVLDFSASTGPSAASYALQASPDSSNRGEPQPLGATGTTVKLVDSPGVLFEVQRGAVTSQVRLELTTADGVQWACVPPDRKDVVHEAVGPLRSVLKFSGPMVASDGVKAWRYLVRLTQWKIQDAIGLDISLCNDQPRPRNRAVRSLVLRLPLGGREIQTTILGQAPRTLAAGQEIRLLQDKDNYFAVSSAQGTAEGSRATGFLSAAGSPRSWTAVMPYFWQTYPAALSARPEGLDIELLPRLSAETYSDAESRKVYSRLYAWFQKGNYLFRAGQLLRRQVFIVPQSFSGDEASKQAAWWSTPLVPQAPAEYLCHSGALGRAVELPTPGTWDAYEKMFTRSFAQHLVDRSKDRTFGWMHFGDWYGERDLNYGNNEYDLAWALAIQWMRTGRREYFDRGQEMARHYSSIDTLHGAFTEGLNGLVWQHSFNHLGTDLSPAELQLPLDDPKTANYLAHYGKSMFRGAIDRQGHVFQEGNWIYAALAGDRFLWDEASRICDNQAQWLTKDFDFSIERAAGWPLINAVAAYRHTGNPYYLNAARLIVQRCLERQSPGGGWLHYPPLDETAGTPTLGGKAFATGILSYGLLRYLDVEPQPRPEVRRMLVRAADWLIEESWLPGRGFRYISNCPALERTAGRGLTSMLNAELVAFAYEQTHEPRYRDFWGEMMKGVLDTSVGGMGKNFAQGVHQTIFGLERIAPWVRQ